MCATGIIMVGIFTLAQDDFVKPEAPPPIVKQVLDRYLKAVTSRDLKAMNALADVPWLDRDRSIIRNRVDLNKALEGVVTQLPPDLGQRTVESFPCKKLREKMKDQALRKVLDELVGEEGWLVDVLEEGFPLAERTILIRVTGERAAVVAGPLKPNQLTPTNRIPQAIEGLLDRSESFVMYSLEPEPEPDKDGKPVEVKNGFHGWKMLGSTEIKVEADRKRLVESLRLSVEDNFGMVAACFIPRHGIRLREGGKTVDLVICFQCFSVQVYEDGVKQKGFMITGEPQKAFDAVLKAAGIKLPKPAMR